MKYTRNDGTSYISACILHRIDTIEKSKEAKIGRMGISKGQIAAMTNVHFTHRGVCI